MPRFGIALSLMLSAASVCSFQNQQLPVRGLASEKVNSRRETAKFQRGVSASSSHSEFGDSSLSDALNTVTSAAKDTIASAVLDEPDLDEAEIAERKKMVQNRIQTYKVPLPLASISIEGNPKVLSMGLCLCQISKGRVFEPKNLNLDTLEFEEFDSSRNTEDMEFMNEQGLSRRIDGEFQGLVVSSFPGSPTYCL